MRWIVARDLTGDLARVRGACVERALLSSPSGDRSYSERNEMPCDLRTGSPRTR